MADAKPAGALARFLDNDITHSFFSTPTAIIAAVGAPNLKLQFDIYHRQIVSGDVMMGLSANLPLIGHVQIAGVPERKEPDRGEVDFRWLMGALDDLGYQGYVGAEYVPTGTTDAGLGWLQAFTLSR